MLQSRRVVKAKTIADRFEVSLRTVYRDIRTLELAGVPIIGEAGVGYALAEGYRLPPVVFEESEAHALIAVEKFVANLMDRQTSEAYTSALIKIKAVLKSGQRDGAERLDEAIVLRSQLRNHFDAELGELFHAVANRFVLRLTYKKRDSEKAEQRDLEPMGCYYHYDNWYLIAWCRLRMDYRTFKVKRIETVEVLEEKFKSVHPSLNEYIEQETKRRPNHLVEVVFPTYMMEFVDNDRFAYGMVNQEIIGEQVKYTFLVPDYHLIARWLLMYGSRVDIIRPIELSQLMRRLVEELGKKYNSPVLETNPA